MLTAQASPGSKHILLVSNTQPDFCDDGYPLCALDATLARLQKLAALAGFANHIAGSDALAMSAAADFDGDGTADLALPSFDRTQLRIVSFKPEMREIAVVPLPAPAATDLALIPGPPRLIALGLADGSLVTIGRN
jgi:hypothetical protein